MSALEQIAFVEILSFVFGGMLFVGSGAWVGRLLRPHKPNTDKVRTYESGAAPVENAWKPFNPRFYVIAMAFLLFEVETILLMPWAIVWNEQALNQATAGLWMRYTAMSATLFIALLMLGLLYVWGRGVLAHEHPPQPTAPGPEVPPEHYRRINELYSGQNAGAIA